MDAAKIVRHGRREIWYNMRHVDMSGEMLMGCATKASQVRYSAAYPTGRERIPRLETKTTVAISFGTQRPLSQCLL